jgi:hypothetical protein
MRQEAVPHPGGMADPVAENSCSITEDILDHKLLRFSQAVVSVRLKRQFPLMFLLSADVLLQDRNVRPTH